MPTSIFGAVLKGVDATPICIVVQVDQNAEMEHRGFFLLNDSEGRMSRDTLIQTVVEKYSEVNLKSCRVTFGFSPCITSMSDSLELPIVLGILAELGKVDAKAFEGRMYVGPLDLYGDVLEKRGVVAYALAARTAGLALVCAPRNIHHALIVKNLLGLHGVGNIAEAGLLHLLPHVQENSLPVPPIEQPDMADNVVAGFTRVRRALEIAAAGRHNLLLVASNGEDATAFARRLPGIMGDLEEGSTEQLDCARIQSSAGLLGRGEFSSRRPFRAPHHTVSRVGLEGGSSEIGEATLAHNGVLFLDDVPDFSRAALDAIRKVAANGEVCTVGITLPARPVIVASMRPCDCGYNPRHDIRCVCSFTKKVAYYARIASILPIFDMIVDMNEEPDSATPVTYSHSGEATSKIAARVVAARTKKVRSLTGKTTAHQRVALTIARLDGRTEAGEDDFDQASLYVPSKE